MKKKNQQIENTVQVIPPPSRQKGCIALTKMHHIRTEMSSIYRLARAGSLDLSNATKLVYILQAIGRVIEGSDLEARIEALEAQQEDKQNGKY